MAAWTRLAFQSYRDGNWEIYVAKGNGTDPVRVTYHGAADIRPKLNRDSSRIAFVSDRDGDWEIYTMNVDGSDLRKLTDNAIADTMPAWSPDGNQIAYAQEESGRYRLYIMNADGSGKHTIYDNGHSQVHPSWSPDGQSLAWVEVLNSETGGLWIGKADGSGSRQLLADTYLQYPIWRDDGTQIAYDSSYNDIAIDFYWNRVRRYDLARGDSIAFISEHFQTYDQFMGSWSPLGGAIVYTEARYTQVGTTYRFDGYYIYQYPSAINEPQLILGTGLDSSPDWKSIDFAPPTSQVNPLPAYSKAENVNVYWGGSDNGPAGIAAYDVQARVGAQGQWTDWMMDTTELYWRYPGIPGTTVAFRSRARDNAGNQEAWPNEPDAVTTFYTWQITGNVTDNRGLPAIDPTLSISPAPARPVTMDRFGQYDTLLTSNGQNMVSLEAPGYLSRAGEAAYVYGDRRMNLYLTPDGYPSAVADGDFEDLTSWQPDGDIPGHIANEVDYLGAKQGVLLAYCSPFPCSATPQSPFSSGLSQVVTVPADHRPTLAFMSYVNNLGRDSSLEVWVTEGVTRTVPLVIRTASSEWKLHWVDMTPWAGRQVTVTLATVHRDPDTSPYSTSYAHIDNVTLAPWFTPIVEQVTPGTLDLGVATPITVTGQNFLDGITVRLTLGDQIVSRVTFTRVDTQTLTVDLPALGPGIYDLWVINPGGQQSVKVGAIRVGKQSYLPLLVR